MVHGNHVLAVVLGDCESSLTYSLDEIATAVRMGNFGDRNVAKDFLQPGSRSTIVKRGVNSRRCKCMTIRLTAIGELLRQQLQDGELSYTARIYKFAYIIINVQTCWSPARHYNTPSSN